MLPIDIIERPQAFIFIFSIKSKENIFRKSFLFGDILRLFYVSESADDIEIY